MFFNPYGKYKLLKINYMKYFQYSKTKYKCSNFKILPKDYYIRYREELLDTKFDNLISELVLKSGQYHSIYRTGYSKKNNKGIILVKDFNNNIIPYFINFYWDDDLGDHVASIELKNKKLKIILEDFFIKVINEKFSYGFFYLIWQREEKLEINCIKIKKYEECKLPFFFIRTQELPTETENSLSLSLSNGDKIVYDFCDRENLIISKKSYRKDRLYKSEDIYRITNTMVINDIKNYKNNIRTVGLYKIDDYTERLLRIEELDHLLQYLTIDEIITYQILTKTD